MLMLMLNVNERNNPHCKDYMSFMEGKVFNKIVVFHNSMWQLIFNHDNFIVELLRVG